MRNCVWADPANSSNTWVNTGQTCGSYMSDGQVLPYIDIDGEPFMTAKGFICPQNSRCVTVENPNDGTISFDNFLQAMEMVFVIMSFNTFTDIMYKVIDSEYLVASLFFIVGSLALGLWLANLFIAVIVSSYKATSEYSGKANKEDPAAHVAALFSGNNEHIVHICRNIFGRAIHYCRELPLILIMIDIFVQCTANYMSGAQKISSVYKFEIFTTSILGLEILLRLIVYLPNLRLFFSSSMNCIDLALAIITGIILSPPIHNHSILYSWLTFFQIARIYRIIISIYFARDLWARVISNFKPIANITIFYFLITFLVGILACQLLRGVIPQEGDDGVNFFAFQHLANSFLALYVVSTTENWTEIMYTAVESGDSYFARACIAAFFIGWYILSNYVVLNMFVAIITENLDITPDDKRREQVKAYYRDFVTGKKAHNVFQDTTKLLKRIINPSRNTQPNYIDNIPLKMLKQERMETFLLSEENSNEPENVSEINEEKNTRSLMKTIGSIARKPFNILIERHKKKKLENPFHDSNEIREVQGDHPDQILDQFIKKREELHIQRLAYLEKNPRYNKSLNIFIPSHPFRVFCQRIVASSYGERVEGVNPSPIVWYFFSTFMLVATACLVGIAIVVTPLYYKHLVEQYPNEMNWVIVSDMIFCFIFTFESLIKIVADGYYFAPNAYLRSVWGVIDFSVLITLWVNLIQEMHSPTTDARLIKAFKAFRALRLLSFSSQAQQLFHDMIIVGFWKLFSAAIVAIGLLFPFSVWGLNIFRGRLFSCNGDISGSLDQCFGEYVQTPFNWEVLSPQTVIKKYYDFNSFGHSFLILFEIISLEGWVDLLQDVMSITSGFSQPEYYASAYNAIFVVLYNLVGTIFILTLFVSVIIQNYSVIRGSAFMTTDQNLWYELERTLKMARPSKRPAGLVLGSFRYRIYSLVVDPNSRLNKASTINLGILFVVSIVEFYPRISAIQVVRTVSFLFFTFTYCIYVTLRLYAFGVQKFIQRGWDMFAFVVSFSTFIMLMISQFFTEKNANVFLNVQKAFSAGMLILIIPRSRRLDQLLKTCATSASAIGNMLIVWAILYLAYGIAFNQVFGLTRIGPNGTSSINFRTVPRALVLLFRMSCGEGWNQTLDDFLVEYPNCYLDLNGYSDCGSKGYAFTLFISWNILSMYIFANMFVSLVYENFSYVFRTTDIQINRDEIRKFKNKWFEFDPNSTGYIPCDQLYKFLGTLDGYFSINIHEEPWRVRSILFNSRAETNDPYNVDINALNKELRKYPVEQFMARRHHYEKFCQHALYNAVPGKGIAFNKLLLQFPFYKDMKYNDCLKLNDYIMYRNVERIVEDRILQQRMIVGIMTVQAAFRRRIGRIGRMANVSSEDIIPRPRGYSRATTNPFVDQTNENNDSSGTGENIRLMPTRSDIPTIKIDAAY